MAATLSYGKAAREWKVYFFVAPSTILVGLFCYYPCFSTIYNSFFSWNGSDQRTWKGWENYRQIFKDDIFWHSFIPIIIFILANLVKMVPSIAIAVVIHRLKSDTWQYFYRILLVVPMIVPGLVTLFIWKFFYNPNFGALNGILESTGLKNILVTLDHWFHWGGTFQNGIPTAWLAEPNLIIPALVFWGFPWIGAVGVLIFLAGLQNIGSEIYEAAELDGASSLRKFLHIELPLILTQVRLTIILMIIGTLQGYGLQFLLLGSSGGPGGRGMVPGLWMFNRAFVAGQFGYACALGMFLFLFILALTYINEKYLRIEK